MTEYEYITIDELIPRVAVDVPEVPDLILEEKMRSALIEFCERTNLWGVTLDPMTPQIGQNSFDLDIPAGSYIALPMYVRYRGAPLTPATQYVLEQGAADWETATPGLPDRYLLFPGNLLMVSSPLSESIADSLVVKVALKPTEDAYEVPKFLKDDWLEAIKLGTKYRLYDMDDRPWSKPDKSIMTQRKFNAQCRKGAIAARKSNTQVPLQVRPVNFVTGQVQ